MRKLRAPLLAATATVAAGLLAASPASAFLRDFYAFQKESAFTSATFREFSNNSLRCPRESSQAGQVALGAGGFVDNLPNLGLSRLTPARGIGNGAFVTGQEVDPDQREWSLTGQILCATETDVPPASSPAQATYIKDVYTIGLSPLRPDARSPKFSRIVCGGESKAIGAGFRIRNRQRDKEPGVAARLVQRYENGPESGVRVVGHEVEPTDRSWSIAPYAICANVTSAVSGSTYAHRLTQREGTRPPSSSAAKDIHVRCPPGTVIVGGGAQAYEEQGGFARPPRNVMLVSSFPTSPDDSANPDSVFSPNEWYARAVEQQPIDQKWGLVARATCAGLAGPLG